jgi:hypothetical protein
MKNFSAATSALLLFAVPSAMAQQTDRHGNVWNGKDHEPNPAAVQSREKAAGIAPSPTEQQRQNALVEGQARNLIDKSQKQHGDSVAK